MVFPFTKKLFGVSLSEHINKFVIIPQKYIIQMQSGVIYQIRYHLIPINQEHHVSVIVWYAATGRHRQHLFHPFMQVKNREAQ